MAFTGWTVRREEITFGVEVECLVNREALRDAGIGIGGYHSGAEVYGDSPLRGWNVQQDGSIHCSSRGMTAVEIVSPVLTGREGLQQAIAAVRYIRTVLGGKVNNSCGLHIHVCPMSQANGLVLKSLITNTARYELALYAATGSPTRMNSQFARPFAASSVQVDYRVNQTAQAVARIPDTAVGYELANAIPAWVRYTHLNTQPIRSQLGGYGNKPTVEFRTFSGTVNEVKVGAYIMLAVGMVEKAILVKEPGTWEFTPKKGMTSRTPGCEALAGLLRHLGWTIGPKAYKFGALVDDLTPYVHELRRLARKFDGVSRPRDRRVVTGTGTSDY